MQKLERLPTITGTTPTPAAMARFHQRLMNAFVAPVQSDDEDADQYQKRHAAAYAQAQQRVAPPSLPLYGHGWQLAQKRLMTKLGDEAKRVGAPNTVTRQQKRRETLIARKRAESAARKDEIANRRRKKRAVAA